ncbi:substrate-binding domain-containing protein [Niveibacterium sp. 24ML]|uniref:substrate-binding domain-containing protein n=1 Tax=Niveibacterium sp. 24ML TaxID=2985512 RepID=UPI00226E528D|nr:substrate-binding domain-containing protein [Niveibacterium sp. 24ML]MCX9155937.1 substrate-binding domain-containing protein [Niveibacterium sp. 24ML]
MRWARLRCVLALGGMLLAATATATTMAAASPQPYESLASWLAPTPGPGNQGHKRIAVLMHDQRNGGVVGVYRGLEAAAATLGWTLIPANGQDDPKILRLQMMQALTGEADAVVLLGVPATQLDDLLAKAKQWRIPVLGWHAVAEPGSRDGLFTNVSTSPYAVAKQVTDYLVNSHSGRIGIVLISDSRFPIAAHKSATLQAVLASCRRCELLETVDIPISQARDRVPAAVAALNARHGRAWTHTVAINDVYFDHINVPLAELGRSDIRHIAAGDGASVAISRIASGKSQQIASVGEPLDQQGWQLADELNRAFAGLSPSDLQSAPILLTTARLRGLNAPHAGKADAHRRFYARTWRTPAGPGHDNILRVSYPRAQTLDDQRVNYPIELLDLALRAAGTRFVLQPSRVSMKQHRAMAEMAAGDAVSVVWSMTSRERETQYRAIRIPIDKGLFGWRIPLVRRDALPRFAAITEAAELKRLVAGQGHDWPDTQILRDAGFQVSTSVEENLPRMLAAQRFDWYPRGLPEVWQEAASLAGDDLVVEPTLALHYPTAIYFFVRRDNARLAGLIERGLEAAMRDGRFEQLFQATHGDAIARARLADRRIIELPNPLLPPDTPLARKALWHNPTPPHAGEARQD